MERWREPSARCNGERGQVVPLLALVLVVVGAVAWAVGQVGLRAAEAARAQNAADAAALAGAATGEPGAHQAGDSQRGRRSRSSRRWSAAPGSRWSSATPGPRPGPSFLDPPDGGGGGAAQEGLQPAMVAALARAGQLLGTEMPDHLGLPVLRGSGPPVGEPPPESVPGRPPGHVPTRDRTGGRRTELLRAPTPVRGRPGRPLPAAARDRPHTLRAVSLDSAQLTESPCPRGRRGRHRGRRPRRPRFPRRVRSRSATTHP